MAATPSDIAKYTQNGVTDTALDTTIRDRYPNAVDQGETDTFFRLRTDAAVLLAERDGLIMNDPGPHEALELEDTLGLGSTVPVTPNVPTYTIVDDDRGISALLRVRGYALDMNVDRYSVEFV